MDHLDSQRICWLHDVTRVFYSELRRFEPHKTYKTNTKQTRQRCSEMFREGARGSSATNFRLCARTPEEWCHAGSLCRLPESFRKRRTWKSRKTALPPPQSYCQTWSRTPRSQNSSLQGHWRQTRQTLPILVARAIRHLRGEWVLARSDRLWGQALAHSSLEDNSWWNPAEADKTWAQAAIRESKFQRTGMNLCDLKHDLNRFKSIWFLSHLATPLFLSLEFAHIKKENVNHASELVPSLRYDTIP